MAGGGEQRDAAIALKDTFGNAADDISSKAGDFHDITADTALDGARKLNQVDGDLGRNFDGLGDQAPVEPKANPAEGVPKGPAAGPGGSGGSVDDDFHGPGQSSEGNGESTTAGDPVDVVSGQMLTSKVDVALAGQLPMVLRRAYASGYDGGALLGPGWSSTLDQRVVIDTEGIRYYGDDAQVLVYPLPVQPGRPTYPEFGARWPLTWDKAAGDLCIEDPDNGRRLLFSTVGATKHQDRETRPITSSANRNGHRIVYVRDADGLPTEVQHSGGYRIAVETTYTAAGFRLEALRCLQGPNDARGTTVQTYRYDPRGRLIAVTDSTDVPYIYEYDDANRISARIDRNGFRYTYEYDDQGRVIRGIGDGGVFSSSLSYDPGQRVTTVTDSLGTVVAYHYDEHNHIHKTLDALGNAIHAEYDRFGRLASATDALGNSTRYTRDERGNPTRIERADGTALNFAYGEAGRVGQIVWPDATRWDYAYDEHGNLLSVTGPEGPVGTLAYDDRGCLAASTDVLGRTDQVQSAGTGLPLRVVDFDGSTTTYRRDAFGRIFETTGPDGKTVRAGWTPQGRLAWRELPTGREEFTYDPEGNLVRAVTPQGTTSFEYGPFHTVTARVNPSGERLNFSYDTECRLVSVTDSRGLSWTYTRDAAGRVTSETDYDGRTLTYVYDAANRLVERVNAEGQRIGYSRDALGRVLELAGDDGAHTTYALDRNGRLLRAVSGEAELAYTYDAVGRVLTESVDGAVLSNEFDAAGRRLRRVTPSNVVSEWTYDEHSRPATLAAGGGSLTFAYDERGRESYRYLGAGAALGTVWNDGGLRSAQHIWAAEQPVGHVDQGASPVNPASPYTLAHQRVYEYDGIGRLTRIEDQASGAREYTYAADRVTQVRAATWTESYVYNSAGDLTRAALERPETDGAAEPAAEENEYTYTGSRFAAGRGSTYTYDRQGRVVRRTRRTLSGQVRTWEYSWNSQDRLTRVSAPDGTSWHYDYDPIGRRVRKTHRAADGAELSVTRFVWDGPQLVEETAVSGARRTTRTWDYEPGTFRPATQVEQHAVVTDAGGLSDAEVDRRFYAIVADLAGTPRELVTADGRIAWRAETDLWGARQAAFGAEEEAGCPLGFPGQYHDDETDWLYNFHRYYDPLAARYVSPDPLGLTAGPNQYMYVGNPLAWIDPLGLTKVELPTEHPRILNIGAGGNPMPGAYNIDLNPSHPDVVQMDALNMEGIPDGYFDAVHSISPYHFYPVNPETARVMAPGATLQVSGDNKRNKYSRASDAQISEAGLQYDGQPSELIDEHKFAEFKKSNGDPISEDHMGDFKTRTYTKPNAGDECPGSA